MPTLLNYVDEEHANSVIIPPHVMYSNPAGSQGASVFFFSFLFWGDFCFLFNDTLTKKGGLGDLLSFGLYIFLVGYLPRHAGRLAYICFCRRILASS